MAKSSRKKTSKKTGSSSRKSTKSSRGLGPRIEFVRQVDSNHELLVVFLEKFKANSKDAKPSYNFDRASNPVKANLQTLLAKGEIALGLKDVQVFRPLEQKSQAVALIGLSEAEAFTLEHLRAIGAEIKKVADRLKASRVNVWFDDLAGLAKYGSKEFAAAFAEGIRLASYKFDELKSKKESDPKPVHFSLVSSGGTQDMELGLKEAEILCECVNFARRLGDLPGNLMTPSILAQEAVAAARGTALKIDVWSKERIKKERFGGLYGVSLGGGAEPKFIAMEYKGAKSQRPICFVGKGLTFDSGGISIKPSAQMDEMKFDMCGGANVIATMLAIARLKLPVNAIGFVPTTENMPGPMANKPGDILTARNGVTVEVQNTDAEGRLILMDALSYATEKKPAMIVDAATLTGAMLVALGNIHTGFFTKDDDFARKIEAAARNSSELVWRMPMVEDHLKDMKGSYSDLQNISKGRGAGSATAAAFLSQFVDDSIPWAHFDIAGTAWNCSDRLNYVPAKGATGVMIRTFVEIARQYV